MSICPRIVPTLPPLTGSKPTRTCHITGGNYSLVYVYTKWLSPFKLMDHLKSFERTARNKTINKIVAIGVRHESENDVLLDFIEMAVQGIELGGTLPPLKLTRDEANLFALFLIGFNGMDFIPADKKETYYKFMINYYVYSASRIQSEADTYFGDISHVLEQVKK